VSLARRTALNAGANVADQLVSGLYLFISYGILAREAGLRDVALLSLALVIGNAAQASNISLGTGLNRYLPPLAGAGDQDGIARHIQTAMIVTTGFFALFGIAAWYPFALMLDGLVDADLRAAAAMMVLPALVFTVFQNIAMVSQSALGALQMSLSRSIISATTQMGALAACFWVIPEYGALGALWIRVVQTGAMLLIGWLWLWQSLPALPMVPRTASWPIARMQLGVGAKMQVMSICTMLLEPASRVLLGWFGTMEQVAVFSLAWRLVQQVRSMLFFASSAVMPVFGFVGATDEQEKLRIYRHVNLLTGMAVIPAMLAPVALAPLIGSLWLQTAAPDFSIYVALFALGLLPSTYALTSYQLSLSLGDFRANVPAHLLMAAVNLVAGWALGAWFGALGVAIGTATALFLSGLWMAIGNSRLAAVDRAGFDLVGDVRASVAATIAAAICWWMFFKVNDQVTIAVQIAFGLGTCALCCIAALWWHDGRRLLMSTLAPRMRAGSDENRR
jgi:O-antigen/teichoic acid export membrane protein